MIDYRDLIGVSFAYGGRGPLTYDCYGLVMECHRRLGVEIPDYRSPEVLREIASLMNTERYRWKQVAVKTDEGAIPSSALQPGRLLEIRINGHACHVGFIHKPRKFLHTWEDSGGVVENEIYEWRSRIIGVYEYGHDHAA